MPLQDKGPTWDQSETFEEYIYRMVTEGKLKSAAFKPVLSYLGEKRVCEIYEGEVLKRYLSDTGKS